MLGLGMLGWLAFACGATGGAGGFVPSSVAPAASTGDVDAGAPPAAAPDGGDDATPDDASAPDGDDSSSPPRASRCTIGPTPDDVVCDHQSATIGGRTVLWETPLGTPPSDGWPVVVLYQGSLVTPGGASLLAPHGAWQLASTDAILDGVFSSYVEQQLLTQITVIKSLLDDGYAVITPTADGAGFAWDTNLPPWSISWSGSPDAQFLTALFAAMDAGQLGPLSPSRWYAAGVSSGGYMTSRMAISYDGRFRALAIAAGSYASCAGGLPTCTVGPMPADHAPTLFLHGQLDVIVPIQQMYDYYDALVAGSHATKAVVDPNTLHGWAPQAPGEIVAWFDSHP
jgi:pimeloyl-ACP methyl ester carboxylesterase